MTKVFRITWVWRAKGATSEEMHVVAPDAEEALRRFNAYARKYISADMDLDVAAVVAVIDKVLA